MTEWLREGIEGRSLKATLRLYLLGLMVLAPVATALALVFGGQASFVMTPVLASILVAGELAFCYRVKLSKDVGELFRKLWQRIEYKRNAIRNSAITIDLGQMRVRASHPHNANTESHAHNIDRMTGRPEEAVEELVHRALYDSDLFLQALAAVVLEYTDDSRAVDLVIVDLLIRALQERDPSVRDSAAVALGRIRDLRAVEPLVSALADEDESVRSSAAQALRRLITLPTAQTALEPEVIQNIRRLISTDRSDGALSKSKAASKPIEPVRKRA
ncbi:MAG TPA: HEAT repeat domain-containing protein [Blastocatellia bacterium]|nr:HEAT repeat domain-containing protein [Blastocatellia bacterium]